MSAHELERLLWERFDGSLADAEAERLGELMASEPDAGRLESEVASLASQLDAVEEVAVPAGLRDEIHRAVSAERAASEKSEPWCAWLGSLVRPQPLRRLAYVATALAIAVIGYYLVTNEVGSDAGTFTGTAGLIEPTDDTQAVRLDFPSSKGALVLARRDGRLAVELEAGSGLGEARLELRGADLTVVAAARQGDIIHTVQAVDQGLEVAIEGAGRISLLLDVTAGQELAVFVITGGETVLSHRFVVDDPAAERSTTNF